MAFESPKIFSLPSLETVKEAHKKAEAEALLEVPASTNPEPERLWGKAQRLAEERKKLMAPKGGLGLSPLLDERRLRYGIPDSAFTEHAVFDRILVWQIQPRYMEKRQERMESGERLIAYTEIRERLEQMEAPRGVIVTAGLLALDALRSNGMDIGHIVSFGRLAPWAKAIDELMGHIDKVIILAVGDIVSSEDLYENLRNRTVRVLWSEEEKIHKFVDENGKDYRPIMPAIDPSA